MNSANCCEMGARSLILAMLIAWSLRKHLIAMAEGLAPGSGNLIGQAV